MGVWCLTSIPKIFSRQLISRLEKWKLYSDIQPCVHFFTAAQTTLPILLKVCPGRVKNAINIIPGVERGVDGRALRLMIYNKAWNEKKWRNHSEKFRSLILPPGCVHSSIISSWFPTFLFHICGLRAPLLALWWYDMRSNFDLVNSLWSSTSDASH